MSTDDRPQAELVPPTLWDWPASLPPRTQARLRQGPGAHFRLTMPEESFGLNCHALLVLARSPRLAEPTHRAHELHRTTSPVRDRWSVRCRLSLDVPWPERCPESTCRSAASPFVMPTGCTTPFPSHSQSPSLAGSTEAHSVAWVGGLPGFCAAARPPLAHRPPHSCFSSGVVFLPPGTFSGGMAPSHSCRAHPHLLACADNPQDPGALSGSLDP